MLILTRHIGETIAIDDDIQITVKRIRGKQVSLEIEAPRDVTVYREEIYKRIELENQGMLANSVSGSETEASES